MNSIYFRHTCGYFLSILFPLSLTADSLPDDYVKTDFLRYENYVYRKNIKTVTLFKTTGEYQFPAILPGEKNNLSLTFDDLDGGVKKYYYTLIHCDMNWNPSPLMPSFYIDGFDEDQIFDYRYSFNTLQNYTHYQLIFPNDVMAPKISGNYLLLVYLDGDRENIILSRRFIVYEELLEISGKINRPVDIDMKKYAQEVDITVNIEKYPVPDPYHELEVRILQNHRWDNMKTKLKPALIKENLLIYDYNTENVFKGGNQYRRFDIASLRFKSERIKNIIIDSTGNYIALYADESRTIKLYNSESDLNGNYYVRVQEGNDDNTESDYVWVTFRLAYDIQNPRGTVYLFGSLSDWQFYDEFRMKYNDKSFGYETTVYLKQGFYNYEYVIVYDGSNAGDSSFIEGSHYETENDYTILVYRHDFISNYDKITGMKEFNSVRDF